MGGVKDEEKNPSGEAVSTRNNADLGFTTSYDKRTLTTNSSSVSEDDRFEYWLWFNTPSDWTFTNYKVKIDITKVEGKTLQYGEKYGTLSTSKIA